LQIDGPLYVGYGNSASGANVTWINGGSVTIGSISNAQSLNIGRNTSNSGGTNSASLNIVDVVLDGAFLNEVTLGSVSNAFFDTAGHGTLTVGTGAHLIIGDVSLTSVVNLGYIRSAVSGSSGTSALGTLDALEVNADVDLYLSELNVGRNGGDRGTAIGTLKWNQPNPIYATNVYFGRGPSTGILDVPAGGTFLLGTAVDPISRFRIGYHDVGFAGGTSSADLDFTITDPIFEAYVDTELTIGRISNAYFTCTGSGSLVLGSNSSLTVGSASAPAVANIGYIRSAVSGSSKGSATGKLDLTYGTSQIHTDQLNVGRNRGDRGKATGTFTMGDSSVVTTNMGNIGVTNGGSATGTLNLKGGLLAANTVNMGAGGTFNFTGGRLGLGTFNTYGGIGTLDQQGGTLAPGFSRIETSLPGLATINGDYNLFSDGTLEIELFGLTSGLEYDQLIVNGIVDLNADDLDGGMLDVVLGFDTQIGDSFIIIDNDGTDPIQGYFYGLPEGSRFTKTYLNRAYAFEISYFGNTGNDIVLNSELIPAPGAIILGAIGVGFIGWLRRRNML
jgi:hypothetical protein